MLKVSSKILEARHIVAPRCLDVCLILFKNGLSTHVLNKKNTPNAINTGGVQTLTTVSVIQYGVVTGNISKQDSIYLTLIPLSRFRCRITPDHQSGGIREEPL
jgi:hypothetical protein